MFWNLYYLFYSRTLLLWLFPLVYHKGGFSLLTSSLLAIYVNIINLSLIPFSFLAPAEVPNNCFHFLISHSHLSLLLPSSFFLLWMLLSESCQWSSCCSSSFYIYPLFFPHEKYINMYSEIKCYFKHRGNIGEWLRA